MTKPTIIQTLFGRPSQTYSFPSEKVYYSNRQDMVRLAAEARCPESTQVMDTVAAPLRAAKPATYDVKLTRAFSFKAHADTSTDDDDNSENDVFYTPDPSPRTSMVSSQSRVRSTKTSLTYTNTSTTSIASSSLDAHSLLSLTISDVTPMNNTAPSQPPPGDEKSTSLMPTSAVKSTTTPKSQNTTSFPSRMPPPTSMLYRKKTNTQISKSFSKTTPTIMTSMTALLEEEESQNPASVHLVKSSVLITPPRQPQPAPVPLSSAAIPSQRVVQSKRSRSLGYSSAPRVSSLLATYDDRPSPRSAPRNPTNSSKPLSNLASSRVDMYDPTSTALPVFAVDDRPSRGTPGFTSLVLPRTPIPLFQSQPRKGIFNAVSNHVNDTNKFDLTQTGIAQTTMATVEVVRGLCDSSVPFGSRRKLTGLFRRGSVSSTLPVTRGRSQSEDGGLKREVHEQNNVACLPLGFTSYRAPPNHVPSGSILVQVWVVSVDAFDRQLVLGNKGIANATERSLGGAKGMRNQSVPQISPPKRSASLRSTLSRFGRANGVSTAPPSPPSSPLKMVESSAAVGMTPPARTGFIPGRSFAGRVIECGWEVCEEDVKKGDWVVGLLDIKKCGAMAEFVVVDRRRVHRVPYSRMDSSLSPLSQIRSGAPSAGPSKSGSKNNGKTSRLPEKLNNRPRQTCPLTLEELSLLPLCGISAYRAVRTFTYAFSNINCRSEFRDEGWEWIDDDRPSQKSEKAKGKEKDFSVPEPVTNLRKNKCSGLHRPRALVLRGHDGAGAMAVQMLAREGWRVSVHVPCACLTAERECCAEESRESQERGRMQIMEERIRSWGGEEVIFDDGEDMEDTEDARAAVVRVIGRLYHDGVIFDAVLDTVGGKDIWEASERLLKSPGRTPVCDHGGMDKTLGNKRAGAEIEVKQFTTLVGDVPGRAISTAGDHFKAGLRSLNFGVGGAAWRDAREGRKVGYAWINVGQDVDWEGDDIRATLGALLRPALKGAVRPWVGEAVAGGERKRVVPFERAPEIFVGGGKAVLVHGGTMVVNVAS